MYENFYEEYVGIESNVQEAAETAASHPVSSNICTDIETMINDLTSLNSAIESEKTDDTIVSFTNSISTNISTLEAVNSFLTADYTNVEKVYQLLKVDLDLLKQLDEKLKICCESEPVQEDFKKEVTKTTYENGEKVEKKVEVDDVEKFNSAHTLWENTVEAIKADCINVKNRIDEYLNYLNSVNFCLAANGASGIQVPSLSLITINSQDLNRLNFTGGMGVDDIVYEETRFADTDVWYAIIPGYLQPQLAVARDANGKVINRAPSAFAGELGAKLAINFSLTGAGYTNGNKAYRGGGAGLIYDGENLVKLRNNYHDTTLYMDQDGNLGYFYNDPKKNDGKTPEQKLADLNPKWAAKTFYPIAVDGEYVDENKDPNIGGKSVHPRTFIGQTENGDYFVGVCTGRNSDGKQKGMTLKEVYDFSQQVTGGKIKFLMNGDGGGSSSFVYDGKKLNPNTDSKERGRPDIIYWAQT